MNQERRQEAQKLASRPYRVRVSEDETTDGRPIFLARVVELADCVGQGATEREAAEDARLAAVDYIESLLEDDMAVPVPLDDLPISVSSGFRHVRSKF